MTFRDNYQGIQACLLKTGGTQEREVKTCSDLAIDDVSRTSHLLPRALEARRRKYVRNSPRRECCPNRFSDFPDACLTSGLVALQCVVATHGGEFEGSVMQDRVDSGIIGSNKRCE